MENYRLAKLYDADGKLAGVWYVYYSYKHPETGELTRFKIRISSTLKTKTARHERASIVIRALNQQLLQGWSPFDTENTLMMTIKDALKLYLDVKKTQLRPRSYFTYVYHMDRFEAYCKVKKIQFHPISMFDRKRAQQFLDWSVITHKLNNRSYNNYVATMRTLFNFLIERDITITNPFTKIKKLQCEAASIVALNDGELKYVADTLSVYNTRLWLAAQLVFYCFIRPQELVRMQFKHINIVDKFIMLEPKLTKNKKQSIINIPNELYNELIKYKWTYHPDWYIFSKKLEPGKSPRAVKLIYDTWHNYATLFKVNHTLYHLKHTGAGMAFDAGINPRDIQLQSRHHSLDQTMQYLARFRNTPSQQLNQRFPKFGH